jgi:hypothetical protein
MARAKAEKPKDLRIPTQFCEEVDLANRLTDAAHRFALAVEPPAGLMMPDESVWDGHRLDSLFGVPALCRAASHMWSAQEDTKRMASTPLADARTLGVGRIEIAQAPYQNHILRIPRTKQHGQALLVGTAFPTFYPVETATLPNNIRHAPHIGYHLRVVRHADYREMNDAGMRQVESMRVWAKAVLAAQRLANDAATLVAQVFDLAHHTPQAFTILPGLEDVLVAFGVSRERLREARTPLRGTKSFSMPSLRARAPNWAVEWGGHRTTLLSMALAREADWRVYSGTRVAVHEWTYVVDEPE